MSSKLDPFGEYLVKRLIEDKVTNAAVLYDEIRALGYEGGRSILWDFLRPLRSVLEERVTVALRDAAGQAGAGGLGRFQEAGDASRQWVHLHARLLPRRLPGVHRHQALAALLRCHERAFHYLGGVPKEVLYDRMRTVWLRDDHRGDPVCRSPGNEPRCRHTMSPHIATE